MFVSVLCISTVPRETKRGEMKGLAQGLTQRKEQFLAYFMPRGEIRLPYGSPPHQKHGQIHQVTDSGT